MARFLSMKVVAAVRIGIGWDPERLEFAGPASLLPAAATNVGPGSASSVTAVLYLSGRPHYLPEGGTFLLEWWPPATEDGAPERPRHRSLLRSSEGAAVLWAAGPPGGRQLAAEHQLAST
ncbi:unnamed protein product [Polarella glacialis]|uniref:Uncharacterized protein n=1 Tax=Polarella glacialis TaxID=89957 RepID=A0A813H1D9_POLGL|nr:unnamed protein product [Polarella glacialis]